MAEEGHLPPRDARRTKTAAPMENGAPIDTSRDNIKNNGAPQFPNLFSFITITSFT